MTKRAGAATRSTAAESAGRNLLEQAEAQLGVDRGVLVEGSYEQQFVASMLAKYLPQFQLIRAESGRSLIELLGEPDALADRVVAATPLVPSPMEDLVGPFYDTAGLRKWLGVTRQALDGRARTHSLLALATGDGTRVYPAWQFRPDGSVIPHLTPVLRALASGIPDEWSWALWLTAPSDDFEDPETGEELAAWQWLARGNDPALVLSAARADSARWAS